MSRHYNKNSRGRQPTQPGPRLLKTKDISDENYQEPISRRKRGSNLSKYATQVQQNKRRRVARAATSSSESSDDFDGDDASDEQSDDEDDDEDDGEEPAMFAPSQPGLLVGPGLKLNANYFGADRATSVESMFGIPRLDADDDDFPDGEDCLAFEQTLFEERSDEDALYERVNDVSDSDDNDRDQFEEEQLIAEGISSEDELEEIDLLNHIDGMSAYGFGDDSEDGAVVYPPSSQESDSADTAHQRHVHFDIGADALVNPRFSESPTFSRSLLPSAMPAMQGGIFADSAKDDQPADEEYDTDATDDCLPPEARMGIQVLDPAVKPKSPAINAIDAQPVNGPKWGHFIDDGEKPSGILDPTGRIVLITHPHLLGDEFVRRYNDSAASSPGNAFEEVINGSENASTPELNDLALPVSVDVMLGNLNASRDVNGIISGPQETFMPSALGSQGTWDTNRLYGDFGTDSEYQSEGEDVINIHDVIKFDDDSEDSDATTSTPPVFAAPRTPASAGQHRHLSSLNSSTVTAFRRSADPNFTSLKTTPSYSRLTELSSPLAPGSRKRKYIVESPYASPHYAGVTPVQRMSAQEHAQTIPSTPDTVRPKRQRLMTA